MVVVVVVGEKVERIEGGNGMWGKVNSPTGCN